MRGFLSIILHLPRYLRLAWRLMWDTRTPGYLKLIVILAVIYFISPIDLIPEGLIPQIGFGDDIFFLAFAIRNLIAYSPPEVVKEHARAIAENK